MTTTMVPTMSTADRPVASPSPLPVFEHRLAGYRRVWRSSIFSTFLLPVMFLLGMGISVGAYVNRGGDLGVPYLDYIAPGLLASTALQVAMGESSWSIMSAFTWVRTYHAMRASPLRPQDMVGGELLYVTVRVGVSALGFLAVMAAFGVLHTWWSAAVLPIAVLVGLSISAPALAYAASVRSDNMFAILYRFAVIPMTLFAGVFFPVEAMPTVARWIAYASPLWHGVELIRAATLGWPLTVSPFVHIGYLALWAFVGYLLACWRYEKKLTD
jgi:lipooligosaccharide transport system permease protein